METIFILPGNELTVEREGTHYVIRLLSRSAKGGELEERLVIRDIAHDQLVKLLAQGGQVSGHSAPYSGPATVQ